MSGKILINEYGIISDSNAVNTYKQIVQLLKDRGLIDGIGIQCHCFNVDTLSASTITSNLNSLDDLGLDIFVTELDIRGDDSTQLSRYQEKFPAFYNHPAVKGMTLWGYIDGYHWKDTAELVWGPEESAAQRPAMQWLVANYLGGGGSTSTTTTTRGTTTTTTTSTGSTTTTSSGDGGIGCGICNWYGTEYPMCCETQSGWGWEQNTSCISESTCNSP